jgi:hypothetical protein
MGHTPTIPELRKLKQEDQEFKASLGYIDCFSNKQIFKMNEILVCNMDESEDVTLKEAKFKSMLTE